jgi:probable F420-dependent oxidoreductase
VRRFSRFSKLLVVAHPFRFGVLLGTASDGAEWARKARHAEELGYSTIVIPDHFTPHLAAMPALAAAAAATSAIRVGTMVLDNDFRHPAVLARDAATVDILSGGRLELGLGAGWLRSDYERTGIPFDPPGARVGRLEESLRVLKGLFDDGPFTFTGRHYSIEDLDGQPKPLQRPRPPILVGAGGRRLLSIAAREADIIALTASTATGTMSPEMFRGASSETFAEKVRVVREAAGKRFEDLELAAWYFVVNITPDRAEGVKRLAEMFATTGDEILDSQSALVGTEDEIADDLRQRRDILGISYVIVMEGVIDAFAPIVAKLEGT